MNFFKLSGLCVAIFISLNLSSQTKHQTIELGINAGTLIYQGDLAQNVVGNLKSIRPAVGVFASKWVNDYFKLRAGLLTGKLIANDADHKEFLRKQRAFSFSTPLTELSLIMEFHPYGGNLDYKRITPYIFAGAGVSFLNVDRDWSKINLAAFNEKSNTVTGLAFDTLHQPSRILPVIPIGGGLHYSISPKVGLKAEAAYRYTATDYLDGFKFSGNPNRKDSYYSLSLGLSFLLGRDLYDCPAFR